MRKGSKSNKASKVVVLHLDHLQLTLYESYFKENLLSGFGWVKPEACGTVCDCGALRLPWNPTPF